MAVDGCCVCLWDCCGGVVVFLGLLGGGVGVVGGGGGKEGKKKLTLHFGGGSKNLAWDCSRGVAVKKKKTRAEKQRGHSSIWKKL